jgi:hypothetical protein
LVESDVAKGVDGIGSVGGDSEMKRENSALHSEGRVRGDAVAK